MEESCPKGVVAVGGWAGQGITKDQDKQEAGVHCMVAYHGGRREDEGNGGGGGGGGRNFGELAGTQRGTDVMRGGGVAQHQPGVRHPRYVNCPFGCSSRPWSAPVNK